MKRLIILLAGAMLFCTSCSLLSSLASLTQPGYGIDTSTSTTAPGYGGGGVAPGGIGSLLGPNPDHLTATEDPGTGRYGYLNSFGAWAIAPTYRYAKSFNSDLGIAVVQISNGMWGAINTLGQTAINFNFTSSYDVEAAMRSMINGRYQGVDLWEMQDPQSELWGYLDYYGNWHIQPQYRYAKSMNDSGIAVVQFHDGRWGAINRNGQIVIQPNFNSSYDVEAAIRDLRL